MRRISDETTNPPVPPDGAVPPPPPSDRNGAEGAKASQTPAADGSTSREPSNGPPLRLVGLPESADDVLSALDEMSRKIDDLAKELNCLGYFDDDDDDGPRAA